MSLEAEHLDTIESADRNQWNNVVEQSDLGCVYHRYGWLRAVEAATSHEPRHVLVRKKGNPVAALPNFVTEFGPVRQLASIRPGFGGPIATSDEEAAMELLLDAVADCCGGSILFNVFRTYDPRFVRYHTMLTERGYDLTVLSCRFTLDLSDGWEVILENMDSGRRRGIRSGHDNDHEVIEEDVTEETLAAFYEDYVTVMERVDQPPLPRPFVLELRRFADRVKLCSLSVEGDRRGMYLYLLDDEQSAVQHLTTAVTEEHFEYHAPELLHEHAIRWAIDHGYETYEFRGALPDFRDGVFQFKEYFGAHAEPLLVWERGRPGPVLTVLNLGRSLHRRFRS